MSRRWERKKVSAAASRVMAGVLRLRELNAGARGRPVSFFEVSMRPGASHPEIRHRRTHEWVLILEGSQRAVLDGTRLSLKAGDFLSMKPGTWHAFTAGPRGVRALAVFRPPVDWKKPDIERRLR